MAVEINEWTLLDGETGTATGTPIDLRGLNIGRVWLEVVITGTATVAWKCGLTSAGCTKDLGVQHSNGGSTAATTTTTTSLRTIAVNPPPAFISANVSIYGSGSITVTAYGENVN